MLQNRVWGGRRGHCDDMIGGPRFIFTSADKMKDKSRMASHSRKSGGAKVKMLDAVFKSSGSIEYIGDLSDDARMAGIKVFMEMFKRLVQKNPILKKSLKQLTDRSHTRRSGSQKGGGLFDGEFSQEIRDTEARVKLLREQIADDPRNLVNPQKEFLINDYRDYIKEMKKWRQFHNYVYMFSVPLLAPQFARMLMAFVIHIIAFSASTIPMAGATTYNLFVAFMGHLFSPLNRLTENIFRGAGNRDTESEEPDNSGLCRPGTRPDPSLGCVPIFTPKPAAEEASWRLGVTKIGLDTIDAITFNLQHTLADPLQGFATVAVAAVMLWRIHQLVQYEEDEFRKKLERMKAAQRESVRAMTTMEQTARTAHTAALATLGPAFAQLGNGTALMAIATGIFQTGAPAQQQLLMGAPPQPIPRAVPRLGNAPRGSIVGSPRTHTAALEGLVALGAASRRTRAGSRPPGS